jgi:hypothetical protein
VRDGRDLLSAPDWSGRKLWWRSREKTCAYKSGGTAARAPFGGSILVPIDTICPCGSLPRFFGVSSDLTRELLPKVVGGGGADILSAPPIRLRVVVPPFTQSLPLGWSVILAFVPVRELSFWIATWMLPVHGASPGVVPAAWRECGAVWRCRIRFGRLRRCVPLFFKIFKISGTQTATETRRGLRETIRDSRSPRQALSPKNRPRDQNREQRQRVEKLRGRSLVKKTAPPTPPQATPKQPPAIGKALTEILKAIQTSNTKEEILQNVLAIIPKILLDC